MFRDGFGAIDGRASRLEGDEEKRRRFEERKHLVALVGHLRPLIFQEPLLGKAEKSIDRVED